MKNSIVNRYGTLRLVFIVFVFLISISCQPPKKYEIKDLTVEYLTNPLGVDVEQPRFSWKIISEERDVMQSAFQIIVGESLSEVNKKTGSVWNSGKMESGGTVNQVYEGNALQSNATYFWRVRVWFSDESSVWSESASFHTGILNEAEWQAQWITTQDEIVHASPLLRKAFHAEKEIERAFVFVTATGFYELFLNGEKVGNHVLDPGVTDYRKTILYSTYDVTSLLKKGTNMVGAMLGNGAWNFQKTEGRWSWGSGGASFGNPALWMQLMIDYTDGTREVVISDNSWKTTEGPITFNNLYGGEDYDA
ncbi:MAG: alpha-L-rhamnosidase N-terminal domain-containing protein, partial [Mariniphaga sp.]|nr:alpha-L-rhamnosidase N-terminal domain-containing protein [Mariniphaga sp.]